MKSFLIMIIVMPCCYGLDSIAESSLLEMNDHKTTRFTSAPNKNLPVAISFDYPASWGVSPVARPGVIVRIGSSGGDGLDSIIVVANPATNNNPNQNEEEFFSAFDKSRFTFPGMRNPVYEKLLGLGKLKLKVEYDTVGPKPPIMMVTKVENYLALSGGMLVQLQFYSFAGVEENDERYMSRLPKFKTLWNEIVKTVKVE